MGILRRRKREPEYGEPEGARVSENGSDDADRRQGYSSTMADRMRRLDTYSYEFDENEAAEVEARIRNMFYGAKVEDD